MRDLFDPLQPPFDRLEPAVRARIAAAAQAAAWVVGEQVDAGSPPALIVLATGELRGAAATGAPPVVAGQCLDPLGVLCGQVSAHRAVAASAGWLVPRELLCEALTASPGFAAALLRAGGNAQPTGSGAGQAGATAPRLSAHGADAGPSADPTELQSLLAARVDLAELLEAHTADAALDAVSAARRFDTDATAHLIVHDAQQHPPRLGMLTASALRRALTLEGDAGALPIGALANFPLVAVRPDDPLIDALALMAEHRIRRVAVVDEQRVLGVIDQRDVLRFLSNHSDFISWQIAEATSIAALRPAAARISELIVLLHRSGTRVALIARLVQGLNARLFERAWRLIAPPELVAGSCLFVMGSEGRGEQLIRTDQDNALVVRDGLWEGIDVAGSCNAFSAALRDFGYPDCPGRIMVSNPAWRRSASDFATTLRGWLAARDGESLMALAIFLDAHAVCGDASLLHALRAEVDATVRENDALLGRFAAAIDAFPEPPGSAWWQRLLPHGEAHEHFHLKKSALFPLVHGVRSLALAHHVHAGGTEPRLSALTAAGVLPAGLASDLVEALHLFMRLRLDAGLAELTLGQAASGHIHPERLSAIERELLKTALASVRQFKALLRHRFHLELG